MADPSATSRSISTAADHGNNPGESVAPSYTEDDLEVCIREAFTAAVDLGRRSLEEAHRCGYLLHEARGTADRRDGGFRGVCERCDIALRTAYRLVELYEAYPKCANLAHFTSVDAALRAAKPTPALPDPEPEPRPNLRIVRPEPRPAEPDPAPQPITPPVSVVQDAPAPAPAPEPPRPPSLAAQNRDLRQAQGELKAEMTALHQGIADRDKQIETLLRAADPETKRGISKMTDVQLDNTGLRNRNTELQTKLNEAQREAKYWERKSKPFGKIDQADVDEMRERSRKQDNTIMQMEAAIDQSQQDVADRDRRIEAIEQDNRVLRAKLGDGDADADWEALKGRCKALDTTNHHHMQRAEYFRRRMRAHEARMTREGIDWKTPFSIARDGQGQPIE